MRTRRMCVTVHGFAAAGMREGRGEACSGSLNRLGEKGSGCCDCCGCCWNERRAVVPFRARLNGFHEIAQ